MRSGRKKGRSGGNGRSGKVVRVVGLVVAGVVVSNSSAGFRRIRYVISLSSLLVPPTLIAHATRLKILQIFFRYVKSAW